MHQLPAVLRGGARYQQLAIGLLRQGRIRAHQCGVGGGPIVDKDGVERPAANEAYQVTQRLAIERGEAATHHNFPVVLEQRGRNKAVGPRTARAEGGTGGAVGIQALELARHRTVHEIEAAGYHYLYVGLHHQDIHARLYDQKRWGLQDCWLKSRVHYLSPQTRSPWPTQQHD